MAMAGQRQESSAFSPGHSARQMIYLSPVRWESYAQRPHFMVRHFLAHGGRRVLWIDPYPGRLPSLRDLRRAPSLHKQGTAPEAGVEIVVFPALPIEPLPGGFALNRLLFGRQVLRRAQAFAAGGACILGIGKPSRLALTLLRSLAPVRSFYDAMDDFPQFHRGLSRAAMVRSERAIGRRVDRIFVSSATLRDKFAGGPAPVHWLPNAFAPDALPLRAASASAVLGYIGALGEWFDWQQVIALATAVPNFEIRLIGPCLLPPPAGLPANIRICPPCRHDRVADSLRQFRAGIIPFRVTPLTAGVDPIKFYEYRAMGLPVISTRFGEMRRRAGEAGVFFFEDGIASAVANALAYRPGRRALLRWRAANTWGSRFAGLADVLGGRVAAVPTMERKRRSVPR